MARDLDVELTSRMRSVRHPWIVAVTTVKALVTSHQSLATSYRSQVASRNSQARECSPQPSGNQQTNSGIFPRPGLRH